MPGQFRDGHHQCEDGKDQPRPADRLECEAWLAADDKETSGVGRPEWNGGTEQLCGGAGETVHQVIPGQNGEDSGEQRQPGRKLQLSLHLPPKGVALRVGHIRHGRSSAHSRLVKEADCVPITQEIRQAVGRVAMQPRLRMAIAGPLEMT